MVQIDYPNVELVLARRGRSGANWSWNSGELAEYDIWMPYAGRGQLVTPEKTYAVARGDLFILRPGCIYEAYQETGEQLQTLGIHFRLDKGSMHWAGGLPFHLHFSSVDFILQLAERVVNSWRRDLPAYRDEKAGQLWLDALLAEVIKRSRDEALPMNAAKRVMLERICAEISNKPHLDYRVEALAKQMGCSRWQFRRLFSQMTGVGPKTYILNERMNYAKTLLRSTLMPVSQVAESVGIADAFYFSRLFKEKVGISPKQYRDLQ